jgi:uncharacterized protein (DUF433 family)
MEALTTNEVVALFNLDERRVRKEVEHGVLGGPSPPRYDLSAVVYLLTLAKIGFEITTVDDRKKLYALILRGITRLKAPTIALSPIVELKLGQLLNEVTDRIDRFAAWKRKLLTSDRILGGEPVFPKTRLAVRHIGGMLLRGAAVDELREDYPYLSNDDLEFASLYARAYPPIGRPRERQAPAR